VPAPILTIPIDDAAFQRYLKTFAKYQEQLKSQPEMWKGINQSAAAMATVGAEVSAAIAAQADNTKRLMSEEEKREDALQKARKNEEAANKARVRADEAETRRRKRAIEQVKEYTRGLAEATVSLGKWAMFGGGASLAMGALSFWGLDRFVAGVGQERRAAQGVGVSMGQRQGLGLNMQRYFDVNQTLETVANAQADPAQWGVLRMMGLNPKGKDPAQLTNEAALAARSMFLKGNQNLALAQAQGLTQIFSPDDLRRLAATPLKELQASIATSNKFAKNNGLSDEVGRKWQDFTIKMDTAGLALKNKLIDRLSVLEPSLGKLTEAFTGLVLNILTPVNLKLLGDGISVFAKYIGDGKFQDDFKSLMENVSGLGRAISDALVMLGYKSPNAPVAGVTGASDDLFGGAKGSSGGMFKVHGDFNTTRDAVTQFKRWGWTGSQGAGVVANLEAESAMNPFAKGDGGKAYGIAQWHPDRQANYKKLFGHSMQSVTNRAQALREQLEFVQWELTHSEKAAGDALRKQTAAAAAAYVVSTQYERPKDRAGEARKRGHRAAAIHVQLNNQTGASVATSVNSAAN